MAKYLFRMNHADGAGNFEEVAMEVEGLTYIDAKRKSHCKKGFLHSGKGQKLSEIEINYNIDFHHPKEDFGTRYYNIIHT